VHKKAVFFPKTKTLWIIMRETAVHITIVFQNKSSFRAYKLIIIRKVHKLALSTNAITKQHLDQPLYGWF